MKIEMEMTDIQCEYLLYTLEYDSNKWRIIEMTNKKKSLIVKCLIGIGIGVIIGFILGIVLVLTDVEIPKSSFFIALVIVTISIILFFILKLANPIRYVIKGQVDKAIEIYQKQAEKYSQYIRFCNGIYINIANCYNLKENFEDSIEYLQKVDLSKIDKNLHSNYFILFAANLMLLNRDINLAEDYLSKAKQIKEMPGLNVIESYIESCKGNFQNAIGLINEYQRKKQSKVIIGFYNIMYVNRKLEDATNSFFIGLSYQKMNELNAAKQYFDAVSKYKYKIYYSEKARELS